MGANYRERMQAGDYLPGSEAAAEAEEGMTVEELKDALREKDLPVSGSKAELQQRLDKAEE